MRRKCYTTRGVGTRVKFFFVRRIRYGTLASSSSFRLCAIVRDIKIDPRYGQRKTHNIHLPSLVTAVVAQQQRGKRTDSSILFLFASLHFLCTHTEERKERKGEKIGRPVSLSSPLVNEEDASITLTTFQSIDKPGAVLLLPRSYSCCLLILSSSCIKYRRITSNKSYRQKRESHRTLDDERDSSSF